MSQTTSIHFPTSLEEVKNRIISIDPERYASTRNFKDGMVTYLSPYISRGVISTKQVMNHVLENHPPKSIEKFLQELAWRDYWQQIWIEKKDQINKDLKQEQPNVSNHEMPESIIKARTGIEAIDEAIKEFYQTGYLHNHVRMYIAAMACNMGRSHWKVPAQWMYYHLIDGDWASNALSWQWVAGANANKKYLANQENINKYCYTTQSGTFLDVPYEAFAEMEIPDALKQTASPSLITPLPQRTNVSVDTTKPTLIYNYYNLDPNWYSEEEVNRLLLLEPSIFEQYPISQNAVDFMLDLSENIDGIQLFVGDFEEFVQETNVKEIIFKEHPLNTHYRGKEEPRDWMFSVKGYYPSFFVFWKKCKKELIW